MPALVNFKSMEEVRQDREEYQMQRADVNVHVSQLNLSLLSPLTPSSSLVSFISWLMSQILSMLVHN